MCENLCNERIQLREGDALADELLKALDRLKKASAK
jgi:hypothetical protein